MIYGLTGGIGSGKSTASRIFIERGIPVWDADAETHRLYREDLEVMAFVQAHFPSAIVKRKVDRRVLGAIVFANDAMRLHLEDHIGARLGNSLAMFLDTLEGSCVLDVPLLFETGWNARCDKIIVVHCPVGVQRERVLKRGMEESKLDKILAVQWTREQRLVKADFAIDSEQPRYLMEADINAVADLIIAHQLKAR